MNQLESSAEDKRHHLSMIQGAVLRMSTASSTSKSWLLPVVTAAYGYAVAQSEAGVALLGVVAVLVFATLDAHYLRLERAFRGLFRRAVAGEVPLYEMNPRPYFHTANGDPTDLREENCRWSKVVWSWSVAGFHGVFLIAGLLIIGVILAIALAQRLHSVAHLFPCFVH